MANPITWQNVNQDASAAYVAGNLLKNAEASFSGGAGAITGAFDQFQKDRSQANTAAYEAEIAKYTTPEALKAAQDSGVLASLGKQFGIQMDQKVLRNGVRDAQTGLMGDVTAARNYRDGNEMDAIQTAAQKLQLGLDVDRENRGIRVNAAGQAATLAGLNIRTAQNGLTDYDANALVREIEREVKVGTGKGVLTTQEQTAADLVDIQRVDAKYRAFAADLVTKRNAGLITPTQEMEALAGFQASLAKVHGPAAISAVDTKYRPLMNGPARLDPAAVENTAKLAKLAASDQFALDNNPYKREGSDPTTAITGLNKTIESYIPVVKDANGKAISGEANAQAARETVTKSVGTSVEVMDPSTKKMVSVKITNAMANQALLSNGLDNKYGFMDGFIFRPDKYLARIKELASTPQALADFKQFVEIGEGNIRSRK